MSNVTGFKSTEIDSYSKVEPATVTKFGYKRQGQDTNSMVALYEVATATTSSGTTSSSVVMTPSATVYEGDVLEYAGLRSEITHISGSTYTLGRKVDALTSGLAVTIHRPTYIKTNSSGEVSTSTSSSSAVIEEVTGTISALNGEVVVDNPRFCLVELWGTANLTLSFYVRHDTPTGTAEHPITGSTVSLTESITASQALPFNGTNEETWAQFSPVAAQRFIVRASGYTSGTLNVRITNLNWPVDGQALARLVQLATTLASFPQVDYDVGNYGFPALNYDIDLFAWRMAQLTSGDPAGTEPGLITRNIPSGLQAVYPTTSGTSVAAVARGKLAGSSLTTSYQTVLSMGGAARILHIYNGTEVPVIVTFDNGTTDNLELDPYESFACDYVAAGLTLSSSTIQAKLVSGSAATNGGSVRAVITR